MICLFSYNQTVAVESNTFNATSISNKHWQKVFGIDIGMFGIGQIVLPGQNRDVI